jgi:hypothetical protein
MKHRNPILPFFLPAFVGALLLLGIQANGQVNASSANQESIVVPVEENRLFTSEYKSKAEFWKDQTEINPTNENAWICWYKAERYKNYSSHSKEISKSSQETLNTIIEKMKYSVPESFALQYAMYLNEKKSIKAFEHLQKANKIQPNNIEILDDLLAMKVIEGDMAGAKKYSLEIAQKHPFDAPEMEYNRNVLNSLEPNSILLTNGNVDTYPIIIDQQISGLRTDITVVCLDWLNNEIYANQIAQKIGLKNKNIHTDKPYQALSEILQSQSGLPVYLSLTIPPNELAKYSSQLFLTGLVMKYSKFPVDNIPSLVYNWENLFLKNQINAIHELNRNYLPPLIQLYTYYKNKGDTQKADQVRSYVVSIAKLTGQEEKILKLVN